jgi:hypothetical protein
MVAYALSRQGEGPTREPIGSEHAMSVHSGGDP